MCVVFRNYTICSGNYSVGILRHIGKPKLRVKRCKRSGRTRTSLTCDRKPRNSKNDILFVAID